MVKIIFIRHGFLEGKFSDYSRLSFDDFQDLLLKNISPNIDIEKTSFILSKKEFIPEIDFMLCSQENRGIETAEIIKKIFNLGYEKSLLLNEIDFYKGVISREDVEKNDFNFLRRKILTQLYYSNFSEDLESVKKRFLDLLKYVKSLKYNSFLCVTHGWFMRLIYIYSVKGSFKGITLDDLLNTPPSDFLETITIEV